MAFQKHILVGNLGSDPVTREVGERRVTNFSLAVNERNSDGSEVVTWYRVAAWNGLGATCAQYLTKGRLVVVEGSRLKASAYIHHESGEARAMLELTAETVRFLGSAPAPEPEPEPTPAPRAQRHPPRQPTRAKASANGRQRADAQRAPAGYRARQAVEEIPF